MVALDAKFVIKSAQGRAGHRADEFFIGPKTDITRMTSHGAEEILTAIRISKAWAGAYFYFEKVADRNAWDFPLVNVAAAMQVKNGVIDSCRIACGGVSAVPRRLTAVELIVKGKPLGEDIAKLAGAVGDARRLALELQCVQDPADGQSGHPRHPRRQGVSLSLRPSRLLSLPVFGEGRGGASACDGEKKAPPSILPPQPPCDPAWNCFAIRSPSMAATTR